MERPKTQTERRRENFNHAAQAARDLAALALASIDEVLADIEKPPEKPDPDKLQ